MTTFVSLPNDILKEILTTLSNPDLKSFSLIGNTCLLPLIEPIRISRKELALADQTKLACAMVFWIALTQGNVKNSGFMKEFSFLTFKSIKTGTLIATEVPFYPYVAIGFRCFNWATDDLDLMDSWQDWISEKFQGINLRMVKCSLRQTKKKFPRKIAWRIKDTNNSLLLHIFKSMLERGMYKNTKIQLVKQLLEMINTYFITTNNKEQILKRITSKFRESQLILQIRGVEQAQSVVRDVLKFCPCLKNFLNYLIQCTKK